MRLLLDTHAFLWWLDGDRKLSVRARKSIGDESNTIFISAASAWETSIKFRLGKLSAAKDVAADFSAAVRGQGFAPLDISIEHGTRAGALSGHHRDPFDRMLIAQAVAEQMHLVSNEVLFDGYGVARLW